MLFAESNLIKTGQFVKHGLLQIPEQLLELQLVVYEEGLAETKRQLKIILQDQLNFVLSLIFACSVQVDFCVGHIHLNLLQVLCHSAALDIVLERDQLHQGGVHDAFAVAEGEPLARLLQSKAMPGFNHLAHRLRWDGFQNQINFLLKFKDFVLGEVIRFSRSTNFRHNELSGGLGDDLGDFFVCQLI